MTATTAVAVMAAPAAATAAPQDADRAGLRRGLDEVVAAGGVVLVRGAKGWG